MLSIQQRLTLVLGAGVLLLWSLGGVALYWVGRAGLVAQLDNAIEINAQALATCLEYKKNGFKFDLAREFMPPFERTDRPNYYQFWLPDGTPTVRSRSLRNTDLPRREGMLTSPEFWNLTLPNGLPGRAVSVHFLPKESNKQLARRTAESLPLQEVALVVAWPRDELDQQLRLLGTILSLVGIATGAAIALLVPFLVRRELKPLSMLAERAATIDASSLRLRFPTEGMPTELLPIGQRLNDLLSRLEASFARERRFSADVAHELRTPIAELRSLTEVALRWPQDAVASQAAFQDALTIALQMEAVATTLLALARCEAGLLTVHPELVSLPALIQELYQPLIAQAGAKQLTFAWNVSPDACWLIDLAGLRSILGNLLSNAVSHSEVGGSIQLRVEQHGELGRLLLTNTTSNLKPEDLPHLFERFWSKDPARSSSSHCGLGLALSKAWAEALGLELQVALNDRREITFTLSDRLRTDV